MAGMRLRSKRPQPRVQRILVATDRSETAERAVAWAADMAERYGAELLLVQVVAPGSNERAAHEELSQHAVLAGDGGRALVASAEDPADGIVETARAQRADVVVVGSIGMSGRREFLLSNVPNRVSHNAPCTVVIVDTAANR
jgi:ubiquinone biosynthesis protein